ncbi:MAG: hypothetical protein ACRD6W_07625, partial [Nitrososphaerales archaeon]
MKLRQLKSTRTIAIGLTLPASMVNLASWRNQTWPIRRFEAFVRYVLQVEVLERVDIRRSRAGEVRLLEFSSVLDHLPCFQSPIGPD